jgi:hypothetical protein
MMYQDFSIRDLFSSIEAIDDVVTLFRMGLDRKNEALTGAAMEELVEREETSSVASVLDAYFAEKEIREGKDEFTREMLRHLYSMPRDRDGLLRLYAKKMKDEPSWVSPTEWLMEQKDYFLRYYRTSEVKKARPWALKILNNEISE